MHICDPDRLLQIFRFNVLSFTAEASVIGSEAERKRMLGGGGPQRAGDSVEERASNVLSGTVTGFINKTNVCFIMFDAIGNSMGTTTATATATRTAKKAIDLTSLHMTPVDRDDPDDPG